jgi:hypothetical protein
MRRRVKVAEVYLYVFLNSAAGVALSGRLFLDKMHFVSTERKTGCVKDLLEKILCP